MFIGEYSHTIDAKGRLIVPSKFREQLGDEFVVTKGLDGCLFVYENSEWKSFEEKLHALPLTNANARKFSRFFLAGACACEVDRQGRILIPSVLREFAHLEKDVVLVGSIRNFRTRRDTRPIPLSQRTHRPAAHGIWKGRSDDLLHRLCDCTPL